MASRADLGIGLVIGDVLMAGHAVCTAGANLQFVNVVTSHALGVALTDRHVGQAVQPGELRNLVASCATGLSRDRAAMRLVARGALTVAGRASRELLLMTAAAAENCSGLVHGSLMAARAARMP